MAVGVLRTPYQKRFREFPPGTGQYFRALLVGALSDLFCCIQRRSKATLVGDRATNALVTFSSGLMISPYNVYVRYSVLASAQESRAAPAVVDDVVVMPPFSADDPSVAEVSSSVHLLTEILIPALVISASNMLPCDAYDICCPYASRSAVCTSTSCGG